MNESADESVDLERHPNLELVFTKQDVDWVPGALTMMDYLIDAKITPFSDDYDSPVHRRHRGSSSSTSKAPRYSS